MLNKLLRAGENKGLRQRQNLVNQINDFEPELELYQDEEIKEAMAELRQRAEDGESLDELLAESFALTREASKRQLGMRHFDVQLDGGIVLHQGAIAEMKTGEGKTLTATLPAALNALAGEGVHVVTVNDYLARRDAEWMMPVYHALGLSVGVIQAGYSPEQRRQAYDCDITYVTNSEAGFDYLRDNIATSAEERSIQRDYNYAIVDEVDNILIDEARTPLIISGQSSGDSQLYHRFAKLARQMQGEEKSQRAAQGSLTERMEEKVSGKAVADYDYEYDPKHKTVSVTERGVAKAEKFLGVKHLYLAEHGSLVNHLQQALKAEQLYKRDVDYAVVDGQVQIIDEFTGRILEGRRWSEGLHQAIEAKEGVVVQEENQTIATITYQNFFRLYHKLSGMTGTALTEATEFKKIYDINVVEIPTNREMIRIDYTDSIYKSQEGKWNAVLHQIKSCHDQGQPVLVGTISVEVSELISARLDKMGIKHTVLNAKPEYAEREGEIVAEAGRPGSVTIATNMAGRGVDIKLGGNPEHLAKQELVKRGVSEEDFDSEMAEILPAIEAEVASDREKVVEAGGLMIIGTERHESRRIDNQLRGRAGRQGDPGESRFYISAEDDLMKLFGGERLYKTLDRFGTHDDDGNELPIESSMISKQIEKAQRRVEEQNFLTRKRVLEYDDVLNQQREIVYSYRNQLLDAEDLSETIIEQIEDTVEDIARPLLPALDDDYWDQEAFEQALSQVSPLLLEGLDPEGEETETTITQIRDNVEQAYKAKQDEIGKEIMSDAERLILLQIIDDEWRGHLEDMDYLREGIHLRGFAQVEPLVAYKHEAFDLFEQMMASIWENFARYLFALNVEYVEEEPLEAPETPTILPPSPETTDNRKPQTIDNRGDEFKNVGRNQPCPCGSGKKFKLCHGR